jgi:hypothetical protein
MTEYKSIRLINSKPRKVIVDETGKVINENPSKEELKNFEEEQYNYRYGCKPMYTEEELLNELTRYEKENGRPPTEMDLRNNPEYPSYSLYRKRFGNLSIPLRLVGLDVESMVKNGIIKTNDQKARFAEMIVRDHFKEHHIDLAGKNKCSPWDGICPNGKIYDVKSSKFHKNKFWILKTDNKYKENIEIYYFLLFNNDWTDLKYILRVPGKIVEKGNFYIGIQYAKFTVDNMNKYNITEKLRDVLTKYGFFKS